MKMFNVSFTEINICNIYIYIYNFLHTYISAAQRHDLIHVIGILRGHLHPAGAHQIASACMHKTHVGR